MGMYTYLSKSEIELAQTVSNKDINDLLQEVNKRFGLRYLVREFPHTEKRLFKKPVLHKYYSLYALHSHIKDLSAVKSVEEVQCVNFCQDHEWSINSTVKASYIITYLLGILCGADTQSLLPNKPL
jgi:hypothetical protein